MRASFWWLLDDSERLLSKWLEVAVGVNDPGVFSDAYIE